MGQQNKILKILLLSSVAIIGALSLWYTNGMMKKLQEEEYRNIELWSQATQNLINSEPGSDIGFLVEVQQKNTSIPVILVDEDNSIITYKNLDTIAMLDSAYAYSKLREFQNNGKEHFVLRTPDGTVLNKIYYSDSYLLKQLRYYPYIQLAIILLLIVSAYIILNITRQAEQNYVWLGMSKETAHQLGTPISSLLAWVEIMKDNEENAEMSREIEKDVRRLEKITARFSKVGSQPQLKSTNLSEVISNSIEYLQTRIPSGIKIDVNLHSDEIFMPLNAELFEWVIENICKNAVDAIGSEGQISIKTFEGRKYVSIEISDTGKGIPKSKYKTIFKPGYTTKTRGWGLGLSLAKRIVEQYHKGKLFVKTSEIGKGTTFKIMLQKNLKKEK